MTKTRAFERNGRQLEVVAKPAAAGTWVVSVVDAAGLTVSTTGAIPRWSPPAPDETARFTTVEALMDYVIAEITAGRMPLLP